MQLKESETLDDATMAAIAEVKEGAKGELSIKVHSKEGALTLAAKMSGFIDHEDEKRPAQINIVIAERERGF